MAAMITLVGVAIAAFEHNGAAFIRRSATTHETSRRAAIIASEPLFAPVSEILAAQRAAATTAKALERAVSREDYAAAGKLAAELKEYRSADPLYTLRGALTSAVKSEDFSAAQEIQSQLQLLKETRPGLLWRNEVLLLTSGGKALVLLAGDGSTTKPRTLYEARPGAILQQPCWSPCGERVAVSEVDPRGDSSRVLVLSARDGTEVASAPTQPAFFVYYSPSGEFVTFLHAQPNLTPGGPTLVLGSLDVATSVARTVAPGGPLFYALSKDPGAILMHNGHLKEVSFSSDLLLSGSSESWRALCATSHSRIFLLLSDSRALIN